MEVVAALVALLIVVAWVVRMARRSRRRGDTVGRFSAATDALRSIAEHPHATVPEGMEHVEQTPSVHVLEEVRVLNLHTARVSRAERRKPARPDAEALARRKTISIN